MRNSPFDLSGKVAVVTGSSRGIGRASAEMLAQMGAKVVVSSRKADACAAVVERITSEGGTAIAVPTHCGRVDELEALDRSLLSVVVPVFNEEAVLPELLRRGRVARLQHADARADDAGDQREREQRARRDGLLAPANELREPVEPARGRGEHGLVAQVARDVFGEAVRRVVAAPAVFLERLHDDPVEIAAQAPAPADPLAQGRQLGARQ